MTAAFPLPDRRWRMSKRSIRSRCISWPAETSAASSNSPVKGKFRPARQSCVYHWFGALSVIEDQCPAGILGSTSGAAAAAPGRKRCDRACGEEPGATVLRPESGVTGVHFFCQFRSPRRYHAHICRRVWGERNRHPSQRCVPCRTIKARLRYLRACGSSAFRRSRDDPMNSD